MNHNIIKIFIYKRPHILIIVLHVALIVVFD